MKFITEEDLRDLYKIKPFTSYELEPGTRLTPSARQFLADRGMAMYDDDPCILRPAGGPSKPAGQEAKSEETVKEENKNKYKKLNYRLKTMEALFLLAGAELAEKDPCMALSVVKLNEDLRAIGKTAAGEESSSYLTCKDCTGIKEESFSDWMEDCFEITDFHIQFEKSKGILTLHRLRCEMRELSAQLPELITGNSGGEEGLRNEIEIRINRIINALSQMVCVSLGGKECQKTM